MEGRACATLLSAVRADQPDDRPLIPAILSIDMASPALQPALQQALAIDHRKYGPLPDYRDKITPYGVESPDADVQVVIASLRQGHFGTVGTMLTDP